MGNEIEKIYINEENEDFIIHVELNNEFNHIITGSVYPIQKYTIIGESCEKWGYIKDVDGDIHESNCPDDTCRKMFDYYFCWRGVWEGRIYFTDDEYWSTELRVMSSLWNKIEKIFKERIREIIDYDIDE